jgi:uncharacterized protein
VRASGLALALLMALPGCSSEQDSTASPGQVTRVESAILARPDGPVLDQADILPAEEEIVLDERLRQLVRDSENALVVVTVNSLDSQPIEKYAFNLFNDWGIGDADTQRGLLILVAPNERKVRIEVGCGLESTITDELASDIIERRMLPEFREGDYSAGTRAGADALIAQLALPKPANDPGPHTEICRSRARKAA